VRTSFTLLLAVAGLVLGLILAIRAPVGKGAFRFEDQARAHCPSDTVVWVNTYSRIYHFPGVSYHGQNYYGHTKEGAYMCEGDAKAAGNRPASDERHP
jgi:hypothetical protein